MLERVGTLVCFIESGHALRFKTTFKISMKELQILINIVLEQYMYFKVCATLSQLKYSFDELKVVSVIVILNNVNKERKKGNVSSDVTIVGRGNFRRYVGAQQTKNAFINSKEQMIRIGL